MGDDKQRASYAVTHVDESERPLQPLFRAWSLPGSALELEPLRRHVHEVVGQPDPLEPLPIEPNNDRIAWW